jgi:Fe(3+) dicitrate transport protein
MPAAWAAALALVSNTLAAEGPAAASNEVLRLPPVVVIGAKESEKSLSGSGAYLGVEELQAYHGGNVHQILRQVPGVYARDEEGYGLRQNVSLRGVDTTRSGKVTLMEDGVLTAPSPYSSPAAYYTPNINRMSAVEILKGSSQVRFGPLTTGGVINYLSTQIPDNGEGRVRFVYGTDNEILGHAHYGDKASTPVGRVGYLVELFTRRADGFKHIDLTPDFRDGDDTGFTLVEPMLKLSWELPAQKRQALEFKIGYSDLENNETYLGITDDDLRDDPTRRYAASRFDEITSHNTRTYLRHSIELTDNLDLTSTLYYQGFHRNWYKLDSLRNIEGGPASLSLAEALATPGAPLETLRGANGGTLRVRANNRDHWLAGAETVANYRFHTKDLAHEALLGARYHTDVARQYQWQDDYYQTSSGVITNVQLKVGGMGAAGNRRDQTDATALFVQDSMRFGRLTLTPGARYEHLELKYYDRNAADPSTRRGTEDVWAAGLGFNYRHDTRLTVFGGVYRGFSVPDPRANIRDDIVEETSVAAELGARWHPGRGLRVEAALFYTRFEDLIVLDNIVSAGSGTTENAGNINCYGVEWRSQYDPCADRDWGIRTPLFATVTFTRAKLDGDARSASGESIFAGGKDGNDVPYIPDWQCAAGAGAHFDRCGAEIRVTFVNEMYTTANNSTLQVNPVTGKPDARFGKTDTCFTVDLSGYYQLNKQAKITGSVQNLFDATHIVSRHPYGARPNRPLSALVGVEVRF